MDIYTPRYRHMHTQDEVRGWYTDLGLPDIATTEIRDWGFGMKACRPIGATATLNEPAEVAASPAASVKG